MRDSARHFLSEFDLSADEFRRIIKRGSEFRKEHEAGTGEALLPRRTLGMIFEKSSTRTRVSFEVAMTQLGGHAIYPCQMLADMQTFLDHSGDIRGKRVAWIGDGNNMCNSYINTAKLLDFELLIACPGRPCRYRCLGQHGPGV